MTQTGKKVKGTVLPYEKVSLYFSFSFILSMKINCYSDCSVIHNMLLPRDANCNLILADAEKKEREKTNKMQKQRAGGLCDPSYGNTVSFPPVYFLLRCFFC